MTGWASFHLEPFNPTCDKIVPAQRTSHPKNLPKKNPAGFLQAPPKLLITPSRPKRILLKLFISPENTLLRVLPSGGQCGIYQAWYFKMNVGRDLV
jgi:hypothetical protein